MSHRSTLAAFLTLIISLSCFLQSTSASLLAIDYGTEFIKASLIKPGVPFDVLLNRDSKRKIASSVAWKGDERLFGADAFNLVSVPYLESFQTRSLTCYRQLGFQLTPLPILNSSKECLLTQVQLIHSGPLVLSS